MNLIKDLKKILQIFSYKDQQKLFLVSLIQVVLAALDLLGVAIIGIIGAVTVYGIQSKGTSDRVLTILEFFNLESMTFQRQVAYLGAFAVFIFITKTVSSVFLTITMSIGFQASLFDTPIYCFANFSIVGIMPTSLL